MIDKSNGLIGDAAPHIEHRISRLDGTHFEHPFSVVRDRWKGVGHVEKVE